jgi:uncharacterized protein (TIRG00374 family)
MVFQARDKTDRRWLANWRSWFVGFFAIAVLTFFILHIAELEIFAQLVKRAEPFWLLLAFALQILTYASVASGWSVVLRVAGSPQPLPKLIRIAISKLFADQAMPSAGMGGNILLIDQLVVAGVQRSNAIAALLISMIGFYIAFALMAMTMLVFLFFDHKATPLIAGLVSIFLIIAFAIPALALWLRHRGSEVLPSRIERIGFIRNLLELMADAPSSLMNNRILLAKVTGFNVIVFLADVATLWVCLLALGETSALSAVFIALIMAQIVATIGPIPLGLGSFEATSTAMLHLLGMPVESAFAGTMLLRLFTMWLPMLPGLFLLRKTLHHGEYSA